MLCIYHNHFFFLVSVESVSLPEANLGGAGCLGFITKGICANLGKMKGDQGLGIWSQFLKTVTSYYNLCSVY